MYIFNYNIAKMIKLSQHFSLDEFVRSETAKKHDIQNIPSLQHREALQSLVNEILEPLRMEYGKPITISSGYRCKELNKKVGGSPTSQHCTGEAVDIVVKSNDLAEVFAMIINNNLPFDQLIWENTWIHVSYSERNRRQILKYHPKSKSRSSWYEDISKNWSNSIGLK